MVHAVKKSRHGPGSHMVKKGEEAAGQSRDQQYVQSNICKGFGSMEERGASKVKSPPWRVNFSG
ncbi:MAG: hypothetical protein A2534_00840 [Candidatus Magasanikbacteria bacterium RIFOXYD2_FULL_39_9]|nr:MAG: hypothetical protein A2534_00840 [Candidatus Magasanikbacteria bacterium RIFOXYD2_FULL_39_9]